MGVTCAGSLGAANTFRKSQVDHVDVLNTDGRRNALNFEDPRHRCRSSFISISACFTVPAIDHSHAPRSCQEWPYQPCASEAKHAAFYSVHLGHGLVLGVPLKRPSSTHFPPWKPDASIHEHKFAVTTSGMKMRPMYPAREDVFTVFPYRQALSGTKTSSTWATAARNVSPDQVWALATFCEALETEQTMPGWSSGTLYWSRASTSLESQGWVVVPSYFLLCVGR